MGKRAQSDMFITAPEERGPLAGLNVLLPDGCGRCGTATGRGPEAHHKIGRASFLRMVSATCAGC
jgi:hypothetical protein